MKKIHHTLSFGIAALLCAAGTAQAQSAGSVLLRAGAAQIRPSVSSGDLSAPSVAGTKIDVDPASQVAGGITLVVTDNVAIDIPIAAPFKHDIVGDGAIAGVGKIGEVKALPATLLVQYRFLEPEAPLRPYVGAGLTYAKFFKARSNATLTALTGGTPANPTTMTVDSKLGASVELGASFALNDRWFIDGAVIHTFLKTTAKLSTGQTIDVKLNPNTIALAVGYRF